MSETEFQEHILMGQNLETDSPKTEGPELETFHCAFQRSQEMHQAQEPIGLIPVYLRKDATKPKQEYYPADLATLTLNTTHEQRSHEKGIDELKQIPNVMELISALLCGERTSENTGVCLQYVQIPTSKMPIRDSLKVSEKIIVELIFPDRNKVAVATGKTKLP